MIRLLFLVLFLASPGLKSAELILLEDTLRELSPEQAYRSFSDPKTKTIPGNKLNAGLTNSVFWLLVKPGNEAPGDLLLIGNPHINRIDMYGIPTGSDPELITVTGDHFKFQQRPFNHPEFVFPLDTHQYTAFLLRVDKHNESLSLSAEVLSLDSLYQLTSKQNLINGILGGILAIIILFGIFLFISVKDSLYLYYVLYILAAFLWVFTNDGYSFQFLWPDSPYLASRMRLIVNFILIIAMIRFMQSFIGQDPNSRMYRSLRIVIGLNIFFLILALTVPYSLAQNNSVIYSFLILNFSLVSITVGMIIYSVVEQIRKNNQMAWFYLSSVAALLLFILAEIFLQAGVLHGKLAYFQEYGIQTGIVVEAIILNFGLAHRFNQYKNEKEALLIQRNRRQQELSGQILAVQEDERRKIAGQLHDEVGSMLSLVNLQISSLLEEKSEHVNSIKLARAGEVLQSVSSAIRNMSHTLTPIAIEKYGLKNAVLDLSNIINLSGKLQVECVIIGFEQEDVKADQLSKDVYHIIQELLNNVIKHAQASHCLIQLIEHPEAFSILVEDDGKGIPNNSPAPDGIGLRNIRFKVEYLQGKLEISARPEGGTLVIIEVPRHV